MKPSSWLALAGIGVVSWLTAMSFELDDDDPTPVDPNTSPLDDYAKKDLAASCDPSPKPGVLLFRSWVKQNWGERAGAPQNVVRDCGLGGTSEHHEGRAWDWAIDSTTSQAACLKHLLQSDHLGRPHAMLRRAGLMYMIYDRLIWRAYDHPDAHVWAPYTGPNPHTDHVHFSFSWDGAMARTSLYGELSKPGGIA